jgi:hypothetical protein
MFYVKFSDQESKLVSQEYKKFKFPAHLKIDPNSEELSYVALKGTTFKRKTMLEPKIESIPREFANNQLAIPLRGIAELEEEGPDEPMEESDISDRIQVKNT